MTSSENVVIDLGDHEVDASSDRLRWGSCGRDLLGSRRSPANRIASTSPSAFVGRARSRLPDHLCRLVAAVRRPLSLGLINVAAASIVSPRQRRSSRNRRETTSSTARILSSFSGEGGNEREGRRSLTRRSMHEASTELRETGDEAFAKS